MELSVERLTVRFGEEVVFRDLSFTIGGHEEQAGYVVALLGHNASGKTTLLKEIWAPRTENARAITIKPARTVCEYLPQRALVLDHLTIGDNINLYKTIRATRDHFRPDRLRRAVELLQLNGIEEKRVRAPIGGEFHVSGGELQRAAIARALSISASLLLLDEPCGNLDPPIRREFLLDLKRLAREFNVLVLFSSHDPLEALLVADEVLVLTREKSGADGRPRKYDSAVLERFIPSEVWPVLPSRAVAELFATAGSWCWAVDATGDGTTWTSSGVVVTTGPLTVPPGRYGAFAQAELVQDDSAARAATSSRDVGKDVPEYRVDYAGSSLYGWFRTGDSNEQLVRTAVPRPTSSAEHSLRVAIGAAVLFRTDADHAPAATSKPSNGVPSRGQSS